jgi:hypothetical protein
MKSNHPLVFLTHQWTDVWWKAFGEGKELFILLVYDGNELVAIAPFMRNKGKHTLIGKPNISVMVKKIEFIANVHSNRCDIIYKDSPEEVCDSIVNFLLSEHKSSWDIMSLEYILRDSPITKCLRSSFDKNTVCSKQYPQISSPYLHINCEWKDYFKNRQRRFKEQLKSRFQKLEESGKVRLERFQKLDGLKTALEQVFDVASKTWKAKDGTALSSTDQLKGFYSELAHTAAKEGWLELFILYLNDIALAFEYCLKFDDKLMLLKTEFDEGYRSFGIGNMIQWKLLEDIFNNGINEFDFLGPSSRWKNYWADGNEREHVIFFAFNKNNKGKILNLTYSAKDFAKKMLGKKELE